MSRENDLVLGFQVSGSARECKNEKPETRNQKRVLFRQRRCDPLRIDSPYRSCLEIREPHGSQANSQRIAPFTYELLDHFVGGRIDSRYWKSEGCHPHRSFARGYVATRARYPNFYGRDYFVSLRVDSRNRAIGLVERPDGSLPHCQEARGFGYRNGVGNQVSIRIHAAHQISLSAGYPNRALAESGHVGASSDV